MSRKFFLLSPANGAGKRAGYLMRPEASFDLALKLRSAEGAPIGEVFAFMSGLYFRGKLAYSAAFATGGRYVIVPGQGLLPPEHRVDLPALQAIAQVGVDLAERNYTEPLKLGAAILKSELLPDDIVILLGSVATAKYLAPLRETFGSRLRYPRAFVGLGDMSRGSLMLKCAQQGRELEYVAA